MDKQAKQSGQVKKQTAHRPGSGQATHGDSRPKVDERALAKPVVTETRSGGSGTAARAGLELRYMAASEVRIVKGDDGKSKLVGYAAVFNSPSVPLKLDNGKSFVERIAPGAFANSLAGGADMQLLRDHNPEKVLARTSAKTLRLSEDDKGLKFEADLPDTTLAKDTLSDVEHGNIRGMSFGFSNPTDEWKKDDKGQNQRTLKSVTLGEVSATPYPAYGDTVVSTRSIEQAIEKLDTPAAGGAAPANTAEENRGGREVFMVIRGDDGKEVRCGGSYGYDSANYGGNVNSAAGMVRDYARATHDAISNLISKTNGLDRDMGDSEQQAVGDAGDAVDDLSDKIGDFYGALGGDGTDVDTQENSQRSEEKPGSQTPAPTPATERRGRSPSLRSACNGAVRSLRSAHDQCNSAMDAMGRSEKGKQTDAEQRSVRDAVMHAGHVARKAAEMRSAATAFGIELEPAEAPSTVTDATVGDGSGGQGGPQTKVPGVTPGDGGGRANPGAFMEFVSDLPVPEEVKQGAIRSLLKRDDTETDSAREGGGAVDADTLARAKKAIADGKTDDGKWSAPAKKDRDQKDCLGSDLSYPIFTTDGKVSLASLRDCAARGAKNAPKVGEAASELLKLAEKKKD